MASIEETASGYRVYVCKLGVRDTKTFGKGEKVAAKQWGTTREAEIIAGAKLAKSKTGHTVKQLIEEFMRGPMLQRHGYVWELGRCKWFLKNLPFVSTHVRRLEEEEVEEWIIERANVVTGASVRRDLQLLGPMFEWARAKKKWVDVNVIHTVKWPENNEPRNKRISDKDAQAIIDALGYVRGTEAVTKAERVAVAFLLALETGMRRGELLKTEWSNHYPDYIHLPAAITKNRYRRDVPLSPEAKALIECIPRHDALMLAGLTADTADTLFREARNRTYLTDLHFHDTRHEAVTRLARRLEVLDLAAMIGHRDINSLKIYYNPTPSEIAARLARPG